MLGGFDIVVVAFVVLVILVLFAGIKTVPQGYRYTIERFGRYTKTLEPGLNLILPFIDRVGSKMNVMVVARRVLAEFQEMPGLALTPRQASRLFGLSEELCRAVLELLVDAAYLRQTVSGKVTLGDRLAA